MFTGARFSVQEMTRLNWNKYRQIIEKEYQEIPEKQTTEFSWITNIGITDKNIEKLLKKNVFEIWKEKKNLHIRTELQKRHLTMKKI